MSRPSLRHVSLKRWVGFMTHAHHDDSQDRLTKFRDRLAEELRSQIGIEFEIFMDSDAIKLGWQWRHRLEEGLAASTLLLPIITPSFLTSPYCREELHTFRGQERALDRDDLILPVYYIDCERFLTSANEAAAATLRVVLERRYFDWRGLRSLHRGDRRVETARRALAEQILMAVARPPVEPPHPGPGADEVEGSTGDVPALSHRVAVRTPSDVLPSCCVRIDVGGRPAGSGFFAAPGVVVTSHHVLRMGDLPSDEAGASVSVISPTGASYQILDTLEVSEEDDLAILRVEPAHAHGFVLLDTGFRARDAFSTFGFSEEHPDGTAAPLVAERWLELDRTLEVAKDAIGHGMSGSPVLNRRTGAVCGILLRGGVQPGPDAGRSSGCHVVSARRLFTLSPTLSGVNFRYHTTHRATWFDLLPAKEQKLLLAQRASDPASLPDCLLIISVDQSAEDLEVRATVRRRDEDQDEWISELDLGPIKVDLNSLRALVARVFRDWASRDAAEQGRVGPGEQIRLLGEILSRALLTAEIGEAFDDLVARLDLGWIEVALHFSDVDDPDFNEFLQLPWEHLYVPQRGGRGDIYIARERKLAFVRTLHLEPSTPEPSGGKISLLVVAVKPESRDGSDEDGPDREVDEITSGLVSLGDALPELDVTVIESPGLHGLAKAVSSGEYDAVHYVGLARFDSGSDDRVTLAINPTGRGGYHNASDFGACLEGDHMPRLVVLQVCRSVETVPPDLAAFGPALLMKEGCLAVVAHQYPVSSALTQKFNTALYTALTDGTALEMAAQIARRKIWASDSEGRAFLSPAVFVHNPGGLRLIHKGRGTASRTRVGVSSGHVGSSEVVHRPDRRHDAAGGGGRRFPPHSPTRGQGRRRPLSEPADAVVDMPDVHAEPVQDELSGDELAAQHVRRFGSELWAARAQDRRNAQARRVFISNFPMLTESEVALRVADRRAYTPEVVKRWRDDGYIFAVTIDGRELYPGFQFADGTPRSSVREAVRAFRAGGASDWQLALWFGNPDPWLGVAPAQALSESPDEVARAARRVFEVPL